MPRAAGQAMHGAFELRRTAPSGRAASRADIAALWSALGRGGRLFGSLPRQTLRKPSPSQVAATRAVAVSLDEQVGR